MKILLLGKNGQVGWELQRSLSALGEVIALGREGTPGLCGDLANLEGLAQTIQTVRPHVVVNAAAYTAVDKAEAEPETARLLNAQAAEVLARECAQLRAWLVHYSTDYVFDGSGNVPWKETDTCAPLSVYGQTKLEGEQLIQHSGCQHLIFRTSWVYGARGGNFAKTMLRLAKERARLSVIEDQFGAPTGADLLADVTAHAIRHVVPPIGHNLLTPSGIYHLAARGETTWHGYARFVLETAQNAGVPLKATPDKVDAISTSAFPTPARRPHNSRLNTKLLENILGIQLPHWQPGVARMLAEILQEPHP
jgi:dTDP-4-dehydrorhamnose reductase